MGSSYVQHSAGGGEGLGGDQTNTVLNQLDTKSLHGLHGWMMLLLSDQVPEISNPFPFSAEPDLLGWNTPSMSCSSHAKDVTKKSVVCSSSSWFRRSSSKQLVQTTSKQVGVGAPSCNSSSTYIHVKEASSGMMGSHCPEWSGREPPAPAPGCQSVSSGKLHHSSFHQTIVEETFNEIIKIVNSFCITSNVTDHARPGF